MDVLVFFMLYMLICRVRLPAGLDPSTRMDFEVLAEMGLNKEFWI